MKRLFHKFASNGEKGTAEVGLIKEKSNNLEICEKQVILEGLPARPRQSNGGDRVRSLAARFESMSTGNDIKQQKMEVSLFPLRKSSLPPKSQSAFHKDGKEVTGTAKVAEKINATPIQQASETSLDRQELGTRQSLEEAILSPTQVDRLPSDDQLGEKTIHISSFTGEGKMANSISDISSEGSSQQAQQPANKTVVFAPSPEKPQRPTSPRLAGQMYDDNTQQSASSSSLVAHFATPTVASSARVKFTSKHHSADMTMLQTRSNLIPAFSGSAESGHLSRPSSSLSNKKVSVRRTISASGPGRPQSTSSSNSAVDKTLRSLATSNRTASRPMTRAISSNASLKASHEVMTPTSSRNVSMRAAKRCTSPLSIGSSSSRINGSLLHHGVDSRRSSWAGRTDSTESMNFSWSSIGAKSIGGPSWSEMTQEDLVANLGARERTRQEVLWEIVASEERYVSDLLRTVELYIDPLLQPLHFKHLFNTQKSPVKSPSTSTPNRKPPTQQRVGCATEMRDDLPNESRCVDSDVEAKIGSKQLMSDRAISTHTPVGESSELTILSPSSTPTRIGDFGKASPIDLRRWSNGRLVRIKNITNNEGALKELIVPLNTSLRVALEAISQGLLGAHLLLSEALKSRYEEQWPLVRTLADVFAKHDQVWNHYSDYVLHLERALDTLDEAALMEKAMRGKRFKKDKMPSSVALGRAIASLESAAMEQGECSLSIFLAMPFQRLLKYPLLFQNLLFNTDASTFEFERTVKMVVDIERIVRSIEDSKFDKEERDKVIDAFARIDGIKDKSLLRPRTDRMLVEERAVYEEDSRRASSVVAEEHQGLNQMSSKERPLSYDSHQANALASSPLSLRTAAKEKRSYRRLSDYLTIDDRQRTTKIPTMGSKKDVWVIRFSDVEIKCQRVGVTALPIVSALVLQSTQQDMDITTSGDLQAENPVTLTEEEIRIKDDFKRSKESKERLSALRSTTLRSKTRNLYKFISVINWKQVEKRQSRELNQLLGLTSTQELDEDDDDEKYDSDDGSSRTSLETDVGVLDPERYIRQSKLSFSYLGQDRVEPVFSRGGTPYRAQAQRTNPAMTHDHKDYDKLKRHLDTSTSFHNKTSAYLSSKMVISNAHAKTRADKFGTRLRRSGDCAVHATSEAGSMLSRMKNEFSSSASSDYEHEHLVIPQMQESPQLPVLEDTSTTNCSQRVGMSQDQSIDSNLRLIGSLINDGEEQCTWG